MGHIDLATTVWPAGLYGTLSVTAVDTETLIG